MKTNKTNLFLALLLGAFMAGCGSKETSTLEKRKQELTIKEKALADLKAEIKILQQEIEKLDTTARDNSIAVYAEPVRKGSYKNPFQLQGLVESEENVMITPEVPGRLLSITVKEGQRVSKGQVIATMDASVLIAQIGELNSAQSLAETNYKKQKALWDQKIGSEMQYLTARNQFDNLTKSLETAQQQLAKYTLRSPISGTVDEIMANVGELVGSMTGGPIARIVNLNDIKIKANVSEKYVGQMKTGMMVDVFFPSINLTITERIDAVGNVIDIDNRTFSVYVRPKSNKSLLKPNMLALITAYDYVESDIISVPTKLVRNDGEKDYVLTIETNGSKMTVKKTEVEVAKEFAAMTIIKSGLKPGDLIITEGHNIVIEGDQVKIIQRN